MIRMGDEFLRTQHGNANPYDIDDATTWVDWQKLTANAAFAEFTRKLIAFRNAHPAICRSRFWRSDVSWYGANGAPDISPDSHSIAYVVHGASVADKDVLVMVNMYWQDVSFVLQEPGPWSRVVDTSLDDIADPIPIAGPFHRRGNPLRHCRRQSLRTLVYIPIDDDRRRQDA